MNLSRDGNLKKIKSEIANFTFFDPKKLKKPC